MNIEHAIAALAIVPRNIVVRAIIFAGLVAPWIWLVAIDSLLRRKR